MEGASVGGFKVSEDGDIAAFKPDGKPMRIRHADGSRTDSTHAVAKDTTKNASV